MGAGRGVDIPPGLPEVVLFDTAEQGVAMYSQDPRGFGRVAMGLLKRQIYQIPLHSFKEV